MYHRKTKRSQNNNDRATHLTFISNRWSGVLHYASVIGPVTVCTNKHKCFLFQIYSSPWITNPLFFVTKARTRGLPSPPSPCTAARWPSIPRWKSRWWRFTEKERKKRENERNGEMKGSPGRALFIWSLRSWDCRGEGMSLFHCLFLSLSFITEASGPLHISSERERESELDKTVLSGAFAGGIFS